MPPKPDNSSINSTRTWVPHPLRSFIAQWVGKHEPIAAKAAAPIRTRMGAPCLDFETWESAVAYQPAHPHRLPPPRLPAVPRQLSRVRLRHQRRQQHGFDLRMWSTSASDRELPVGQNPVAVTASATRNEVYVVNSGAPATSRLHHRHQCGRTTPSPPPSPVRRQPVALALAPKNDLAYVANSASNNVSVIDLKTRHEVAVIGAGEQPSALRVSPDGKDSCRRQPPRQLRQPHRSRYATGPRVFSGCPGASDVVILPDSSKVFAACSAGHQIMAIALAHAAGKPTPADPAQPDRVEALLGVGHQPLQLALKPDGGEIFVTNSQSDSISEIITGHQRCAGRIPDGRQPRARSGLRRQCPCSTSATCARREVTIYAIDDGKRAGAIHVGDGPSALAFSSAGHLLFVVDAGSGDVAVVRTASHSLFTLLPAGRGPNAIAVKAFKLP